MRSTLATLVALAGCSRARDTRRSSDPPSSRPPACRAASDCELQSRCYWTQPPECVPHGEWREVLCSDSDPPDPSREPETCGCVAARCVVVK